jgi:general stress protein YciG
MAIPAASACRTIMRRASCRAIRSDVICFWRPPSVRNKGEAREIASKGGQAASGNFGNDPERASEAGKKGGQASSGNFANDPERASEAGRKGGEASHAGRGR